MLHNSTMLGSLISWAAQTAHEKKKPFCEHLPMISAGTARGSVVPVLILIIAMSCSGLLTAAEPSLEMSPHKSQYTVGESWVITATGPPNTPITVRATHNSQSQGIATFGYTDSTGNFRFNGTMLSSSIGYWEQEWFVGGVSVNWFVFDVVPAPVPCTFQLSNNTIYLVGLHTFYWISPPYGGGFWVGTASVIGTGSVKVSYPDAPNCSIQSWYKENNNPWLKITTSTTKNNGMVETKFNLTETSTVETHPDVYPLATSDKLKIITKDSSSGSTNTLNVDVSIYISSEKRY